MVLDLISASYIGWPTSRFASLILSARLSSDWQCKGTTFFVRFQILPLDLGRFSARIWWIWTNRNFEPSNP